MKSGQGLNNKVMLFGLAIFLSLIFAVLHLKITNIGLHAEFKNLYYIIILMIVSIIIFIYFIRSNQVLLVGTLLSVFVFAVSIITFPPGPGDSMWNVPVGLSLMQEGNIDINEYIDLIKSRNYYGVVELNGSYYNYFPIGGTIIPLPFIILGYFIFGEDLLLIELFSSKIIYILNVFFFYILCWELSRNTSISVILSMIFAFATPNFHIISGALWTHGSAELMVILALLVLLYGNHRQSDISSSSAIFLFLGYLARPTTALLVPIVFLYLIMTRRRYAILFSIFGVLCSGGFILWSIFAFGEPIPPYYVASRLSMETFLVALTGQLVSPNRGLLIFSPFVIFSIVGMYKAIKDPNSDPIFKLLPAFVVIYAIVIAMFPHWWGGWSYGPRLYTDVMPILVIYLYWVIKDLKYSNGKNFSLYIFYFVVAYCFIVQSFAVIDPQYSVHAWNALPTNIDENPGRIWDWSDMQIMRFTPVIKSWSSELSSLRFQEEEDMNQDLVNNCGLQSFSISMGDGWHGPENWDGTPTRWIENDATLIIYSSDSNTVDLSFKTLSFYRPRTLEIYVNDHPYVSMEVQNSNLSVVNIPNIELYKGTNIVRFHVLEGCEMPCDLTELKNSDIRCLSIAYQDICINHYNEE